MNMSMLRWSAGLLALSAALVTVGLSQTPPAAPAGAPPATPAAAPVAAARPPIPADKAIAAIRDEGLNRSHVMQTMDYLCNVIGPRLTGSPELKHANEWTRDQFTAMGMANAHLESWGPFGKGWSLKNFSLTVLGPVAFPVRAYPKAWSWGMDKPLDTEVVFIDAQTQADLAKYQGKLKDKVVLIGNPRTITPAFQPTAVRLADADLARAETLPSGTALAVTVVTPARGGGGAGGGGRAGRGATAPAPGAALPATALGAAPATASAPATAAGTGPARPPALAGPGGSVGQLALSMAASEGAAMVLDCSSSGDGGIIAVSSASVPGPVGGRGQGGSAYAVNAPRFPAEATVCIEDYTRLASLCRNGEKVRISAAMEVEFHTADTNAYNTIAEIPGTDPALKAQIVMAGAHMDSWHGGTGATDNGAGCGAVIEAVRILRALDLQPRRTIRVALWSGEEQGLLGSTAYVLSHFGGGGGRAGGGRAGGVGGGAGAAGAAGGRGATRGPEFDNFSVYFNLDNGTGKIRGIYGQGNDAGGALFKKWLEPFADLGAKTVTLGTNGQTDHISFDNAGLPGFEFIQDGIDYLNRTHHTTADVYSRLQTEDMKVNATVIAAFLWNAANMDERFPRKAAAAGGGAGRRGGGGATAPASAPDPAMTQPIGGGQ